MNSINLHENENAKSNMEDVIKRNTRKQKVSKNRIENKNSSNYIIEYYGNKLTVNFLYSQTKEKKEKIAKFLFDYFRENGFPYPRYSDDELWDDFKKLKKFHSQRVLINDSEISTSFLHGAKIFKHFNHHFWSVSDNRMSQTAIDVFLDDEKLMKIIRNRIGLDFYYRGVPYPFNISHDMIRQGMRSMRFIPHTTSFRSTIAKFLYDIYSKDGDIVYDFSSGFNQRLLGASTSKNNILYLGVDPWKETIEAGKKIIDYFGIKNVFLFEDCSENFCPTKFINKVSLAFSSPPYYDKEVYCNDEKQAYKKGYKDFINNYWHKTVVNIRELLKNGGLFILNICNEFRNDMENEIIKNGFERIKEYKMVISKSHLAKKVGTKNTSKYEHIDVFLKK